MPFTTLNICPIAAKVGSQNFAKVAKFRQIWSHCTQTTCVTRFDKILKILGNFYQGLFSIGQNLKPTLA